MIGACGNAFSSVVLIVVQVIEQRRRIAAGEELLEPPKTSDAYNAKQKAKKLAQ